MYLGVQSEAGDIPNEHPQKAATALYKSDDATFFKFILLPLGAMFVIGLLTGRDSPMSPNALERIDNWRWRQRAKRRR